VDEFGNQVKIGDEEDIGEVSEGFMSRIHEGIEAIMAEDNLDQDPDEMFGDGAESDRPSTNRSSTKKPMTRATNV
jgi:hypothetical protein